MHILSGTAIHQVRPVAAALISILSTHAFANRADGLNTSSSQTPSYASRGVQAQQATGGIAKDASPSNPHNVWTVKNCQDDGTDSLRALISAAGEGDTIEFDMAQMQCSSITLSSAEIPIIRNDLTLQGPMTGAATITISGEGQHRVFNHVGSGTLWLDSLKIEDGYAHGDGGCIRSDGSVSLSRVEVAGCKAVDDITYTYGGGVAAEHDITLRRSTISGNRAGNEMRLGHGGGIHCNNGNALIKYSAVSGNYASARGGGVVVGNGTTYLLSSTIDHNSSKLAAALWLGGDTQVTNSTISSNTGYSDGVAILSRFGSLSVESSTFTLNHDDPAQTTGAIAFMGPSQTDTFTLQSSVVANNTSGPNNISADIFVLPGQGAVFGAANLVGSSNVWPPGVFTLTSDPRLGPLQFNGGFTRTHALLADSPARGIGNDNAAQSADQRGTGYPRVTGTGPSATVDIGAVQFDSIFFGGFEFTN
jgi:hypothetical protein